MKGSSGAIAVPSMVFVFDFPVSPASLTTNLDPQTIPFGQPYAGLSRQITQIILPIVVRSKIVRVESMPTPAQVVEARLELLNHNLPIWAYDIDLDGLALVNLEQPFNEYFSQTIVQSDFTNPLVVGPGSSLALRMTVLQVLSKPLIGGVFVGVGYQISGSDFIAGGPAGSLIFEDV